MLPTQHRFVCVCQCILGYDVSESVLDLIDVYHILSARTLWWNFILFLLTCGKSQFKYQIFDFRVERSIRIAFPNKSYAHNWSKCPSSATWTQNNLQVAPRPASDGTSSNLLQVISERSDVKNFLARTQMNKCS